jgi:hypothetical protein
MTLWFLQKMTKFIVPFELIFHKYKKNTNKFNVALWFNTFYVFMRLKDKMPPKKGYH